MNFTGVPRQPTEFRLTDVKDNTAHFAWIRGFNGGRKQIFLLQISEPGQNSWLNKTFIDELDEYSNLGNKTYIANITDLKPGVYTVQLVAVNDIGPAEPLVLDKTIEVAGMLIYYIHLSLWLVEKHHFMSCVLNSCMMYL